MHTLPYTDLNDINLDWLLQNMHKIVAEWAAYQVSMGNKFDSLEAAYTALQDWINDYFSRLNVQTEINNKLDAMAQGGQLLDIIRPTVISQTDSWLAAHISPGSGYALDNTLTLTNAAAQAKAAGDRINEAFNHRANPENGSDLDNLYEPGWYIIATAYTLDNQPDNQTGYRYVLVFSGATIGANQFRHMVYVNTTRGTLYNRLYSGGSWGSWTNPIRGQLDTALTSTTDAAQGKAVGDAIRALDAAAFQRHDLPSGMTSLDVLTDPGWYIIATGNSDITDCPDGATSGSRIIQIYTGAQAGYRYMVYINHATHYTAMRLYSSGSWGAWSYPDAANLEARITAGDIMIRQATISTATDLDDVNIAGWYIVGNSVTLTNQPGPDADKKGYRLVRVYSGAASTFYEQLYINKTSGCTAMRLHTSTGWTSWTIFSAGNYDNTLQDTITKIIGKKMFDVAHRGITDTYPENSMAAFKTAKAAGFDWVETDIQFTSDGVPVLQHNRNIVSDYCNSDGTDLTGTINIDTITYNQLLQYDRKKGSTHFSGMKVVSLQDAMETFRKIDLSAFLHCKETVSTSNCQDIIDIVDSAGMQWNVALASGYKSVLTEISGLVSRRLIVFVGQASNCNASLAEYLNSLKVNGNIIGYTTGPWAYNTQDMIDIIDNLNEAGYFLTSRVDDETQAANNTRPWSWAFLTNGADGFVPSKYFYDDLMDGFTS